MSVKTLDELCGQDYLDSRDLIETLADLAPGIDVADEQDDPLEAGDQELVDAIRSLEDEGIEDWEYGAQFIREDCFEDYARELAEDIGAIRSDADWPLTYIDWPRAAAALRMDYSAVEFLGFTYLVRS